MDKFIDYFIRASSIDDSVRYKKIYLKIHSRVSSGNYIYDDVSDTEKLVNAEVSTPINLINKILDSYSIDNIKTFFDYACGKGNIIILLFLKLIKNHTLEKVIGTMIYFADINHLNVFITCCTLFVISKLNYNLEFYNFNFYIGDSLKLDTLKTFGKKFDCLFVNPPFQDTIKRNNTPHKLWIDFTIKSFKDFIVENGVLIQISPTSFSSPSSKILKIFQEKLLLLLYTNQEDYFKGINSTISWYVIRNTKSSNNSTIINGVEHYINKLYYLPNDFSNISLSIHAKVMFNTQDKLSVNKDYVTAHNVLIKKENSTLSKIKTDVHKYSVLHTNKQIWYSSIKQPFLASKKVMWSRSGYTIPFYDPGTLGGTDLVYYVFVDTDEEGLNLTNNLNTKLFKYILKTAKWSGFGNDKVYYLLPKLPNVKYNDKTINKYFNLTNEEISYIDTLVK